MIENDVKQQLIADGIGTDPTIILGSVPTTPGNIIVIGSTAGVLTALENSSFASQNVMVQKSVNLPNVPDTRETLSIIVINDDYTTAHAQIWSVYNDLVSQTSGYKVCNSRQMYFVPVQPPYLLKTDSSKTYFVLNLNVNATKES